MVILGWFLLVCACTWFTGVLGVAALMGGTSLAPLPLKHYWWFLPLIVVCVAFWVDIIGMAPFTISLQ